MSKERARRRAVRESLAQQRQVDQQAALRRQRTRRRLSALGGSWLSPSSRQPRSPASARIKERRAVIASTLLVVVVVTYLMSGSITMVVGVLLIASIATPALAAVFLDRSKK